MTIEDLREEIDSIDDSILDLLLKRIDLCKEIGKIKREKGIKIEDLAREKEILEKVKEISATNSSDAEFVFSSIIKVCKNIQN